MPSPLRTAYDLGRQPDPIEAVVAIDRLANQFRFNPDLLLNFTLAYPEYKVGIEYEGEEHVKAERVLRDIGRTTRLVDKEWKIYRYTKYEVYGEPDRIVAEITRALNRPRETPWGSATA